MPATMTAVLITIDNGEPVPGRFETETEVIEYQSVTATKPDPNWTHTDAAGHWHAYATDGELPTLLARIRHVECAGGCDDEPCEGYDVTDWYCRICNEEVQPGRLPDTEPKSMPGRSHWWAEIESDREITGEHTVRITVGNRVAFGVVMARTVGMEGDMNGVRVKTRLDGIGPLGKR